MQLDTKPWDHTRPEPRNKSIGHFTDVMNDAVPPITPEERQTVCDHIESYGLWSTDIPEMLGLVER